MLVALLCHLLWKPFDFKLTVKSIIYKWFVTCTQKWERTHFWFWLSFLLGPCYNYMASLIKIWIYSAASKRTTSFAVIYCLIKHLKLHLSVRQFWNRFVLLYMHVSHPKFRWGHMRWCAKNQYRANLQLQIKYIRERKTKIWPQLGKTLLCFPWYDLLIGETTFFFYCEWFRVRCRTSVEVGV